MNIKKWFKTFVFGAEEPAGKQNNSSVYINAHGYWARIETNLPTEQTAMVKDAAHKIVDVVLSEQEDIQ